MVTSSPEATTLERKRWTRRPSIELEERVAKLSLEDHRFAGIIPPSLVVQRSGDSADGSTPMGRELLDLPLIKGWMSKVSSGVFHRILLSYKRVLRGGSWSPDLPVAHRESSKTN